MKRAGGLLLLALLLARGITAQDATDASPYPWRTSYFPYFTLSPNDGFLPLFRIVYFRQARFEDRVSLRDAVAVEAGYSTRKSAVLRGRFDFPRIAEGWRLEADAEISKTPHFGAPADEHERNRWNLNAEVTRRISGPFHIAARFGMEHLDIGLGCGEISISYPQLPIGWCGGEYGEPEGQDYTDNDLRARLAVVLDLRDREYETRGGALIEAGAFTGLTGDGYLREPTSGYHGAYGIARGWHSPRAGTLLTVRGGFRALSRTPAIGIRNHIPAWEHSLPVLGGPQSQRGLTLSEDIGRGVLFGGAEVRQQVRSFVKGLVAVSLLGFVDGGRTFNDLSPLVDPLPGAPIPTGRLSFTFDDWQWSYGGGVAIRVLKDASLNVTAAHRPGGGTTWYVSSGWAW